MVSSEGSSKVTVSSLDTTASAKAWRWFTAFHKNLASAVLEGLKEFNSSLSLFNDLRSWRPSNNRSDSFKRSGKESQSSPVMATLNLGSFIFQRKPVGESML